MEGRLPGARLRRHRRLLGLCALSALVHLALLAWFASGPAGRPSALPPGAPGDELVLRLAPAAPAPTPATLADAPAPPDQAAVPVAAPAPPPAPPRRPAPAAALAIPLDEIPATRQDAAGRPAAPPASGAPEAPPDGAPLVQMPGRYRVHMPATVHLRYALTRQGPGRAPERLPDARLDWRSDGERYQLDMDGVLGRLASRGTSGDTGVRPVSAAEEGPGGRLATEFGEGQVRFSATGGGVADTLGIQDRASVLMQLAGIGLAEPDQMRGTIEIAVAGTADARIERYEVLGQEALATPLGTLQAWHLAQRVEAGRQRLEVWLAPGQGWLPVQLRLTGADGTVATQVATAIQAPAAPAPPAG